jgi:hypothetical protein
MIVVSSTPDGHLSILWGAHALRVGKILMTGILLSSVAAAAQGITTQRPVFGSSGGIRASPPVALDDPENARVKVHHDPYGKPCVDVFGVSRPQIVNTNMFDQFVIAENHCSKVIKLKICYFGSFSCAPVDVPPYGRKETLLGFFPTTGEFRYQYTEQF